MPGSDNAKTATERPAAGPATWAVFSDYINRHFRNREKTQRVQANQALKLVYRVGTQTTLDMDAEFIRRYDAEASKLGPIRRYKLLDMLKKIWGIGHGRGWLPPIPEGFPPNPDPYRSPGYRRTPPPSREDLQNFLVHLSKRAGTFPGRAAILWLPSSPPRRSTRVRRCDPRRCGRY